MKYDIIIWDWNGTLIDDCEAALECVNEMLDKTGDSRIDLDEYYSLVDTPIIKFYIELFGTDKIDFDRISEDFHDSYDRKISEISLMPNAVRVLEFCRSNNIRQIIMTSSHTDEVRKLTTRYGIDGYFDDIIGASDRFSEGKTERAVEYFKRNRFDCSRALMIGDTLHDLDTANVLGIECVLISRGHQGEKILKNAGCTVIDDLEYIMDVIEGGTKVSSVYNKIL